MKLIRKIFFNRVMMIGAAILLQFLFLLAMLAFLRNYSQIFYGIGLGISMLAVLWIIYNDLNPAYKIGWIITITLVPIFGGLFYLSFGGNQLSRKEKKRMKHIEEQTIKLLPKNEDVLDQLRSKDHKGAQQAKYIQDYGPYPIYNNTACEYFKLGDDNFIKMKEDLKLAEKFIFIEYFIIEEGQMWQEILDILIDKVKLGVDVRVVYDDLGCSLKLPHKYFKHLRSIGIKCEVFNPLIPIISSKYNTRDHRKIMVIDGCVAYTGGINLADEYINVVEKLGHWKDMGIRLEGEAVWNFTVMFLTSWDYLTREDSNFEDFRYTGDLVEKQGYILPYSDNPLDNESIGENVYLNMINKAERYLYITTPYLIITYEMVTALCNAAKTGVDVKIIMPHIPDKWYVHYVSWSFYDQLMKNGVEILEYEPGFMHGKNFVCDDQYAVVGTINMDFRSLYLHFECGVWMQNTPIIEEIKNDFIETSQKCIKITHDDLRQVGFLKILFGLILRVFAPLM